MSKDQRIERAAKAMWNHLEAQFPQSRPWSSASRKDKDEARKIAAVALAAADTVTPVPA